MVINRYNSGFVALAAVLILSAVFLSVAIGIASKAISHLDADLALYERDLAQYSAHACIEIMLLRLQSELDLSDEEYVVGETVCQVENLLREGQEGVFFIQSAVGDHVYRSEVFFEEISPEVVLSSVRRVGNE